jgi:hypothetical protein
MLQLEKQTNQKTTKEHSSHGISRSHGNTPSPALIAVVSSPCNDLMSCRRFCGSLKRKTLSQVGWDLAQTAETLMNTCLCPLLLMSKINTAVNLKLKGRIYSIYNITI